MHHDGDDASDGSRNVASDVGEHRHRVGLDEACQRIRDFLD